LTEPVAHPVEFLPELALDVLPEGEAERVREHLAGCETCGAEYAEMSRVALLLPLSVEEALPSPALREQVLGRIAVRDTRAPAPPGGRILRPRAWAWAGAAAAAVAAFAVVGGAIGYAIRGDDGALEQEAERQGLVVRAAADGTLRMARAQSGEASAVLLLAPGSTATFAKLENLPTLPEGKAYQAWFTRDGQVLEPGPVFEQAGDGVWLEAGSAVAEFVGFGLTIEDADGAEQPTTDPIFFIDLTQTVRATIAPDGSFVAAPEAEGEGHGQPH
jgi:hypothetical protein